MCRLGSRPRADRPPLRPHPCESRRPQSPGHRPPSSCLSTDRRPSLRASLARWHSGVRWYNDGGLCVQGSARGDVQQVAARQGCCCSHEPVLSHHSRCVLRMQYRAQKNSKTMLYKRTLSVLEPPDTFAPGSIRLSVRLCLSLCICLSCRRFAFLCSQLHTSMGP